MQFVTSVPTPPHVRATALGSLTIVPLLVWWAGWFPGIMSSDSVDQWNQVLIFDFQNAHPITHTAYLWVVSLVWQSPGAVALTQVILSAVVLAFIARRLVQVGVLQWIAVGAVWLISVLPMTGAMTIAIWKDVPFSLAMAWAFTELLLLARDKTQFWSGWQGPLRLGAALGLMWALRANGRFTTVAFVVILGIVFYRQWRGLLVVGSGVVALGVILPASLTVLLPVTSQPFEPAQVFMPQVGSVLVHDPAALSGEDIDLMVAVTPLDVWIDAYDCGNSSPLVFNPAFDNSVVQNDPSAYRSLVLRSALAAPLNVAGHRWCAGEYLLSPYNRTGTYVHRPPFAIWANDIGLERAPLSDRAYAATLWMYQVAEKPGLIWLTWRPAIYVLAGLATFGALWRRPSLRPLNWIGILFIVHLGNVFLTSPSHEFRYAYGLYLFSLASLPLWYLIVDPKRARLSPT